MARRGSRGTARPIPDRVTLVGVRGDGPYFYDHPYVESAYLPMLGPTSFVLLRLLCREYTNFGSPLVMEFAAIGRAIGVLNTTTLMRSFERLELFRCGAWNPDTTVFAFPRDFGPVSSRYEEAAKLNHERTTP